MPRDDLARRLRDALEREPEVTAAVEADNPDLTPGTPLQQLRYLATYGESENVRLQAARILLERDEARRRRGTEEHDDGAVLTVRDIIDRMSPEEIEREADHFCGRRMVEEALANPDARPNFTAALNEAIEARAAERARELVDAVRIDREIQQRAAALAEELHRQHSENRVPAAGSSPQAGGTTLPIDAGLSSDEPFLAPPGVTAAVLRRAWRRPPGGRR